MAKKSRSQGQPNAWAFWINLTNKVYNLCNSGNIIGLLILALIGYVYFVTYSVPKEALPDLITRAGLFLRDEGFYFFPLGITLLISLIANMVQYKTYKKEIKRLTELRKTLIHGFKTGKFKNIDKHSTSNFDFDE